MKEDDASDEDTLGATIEPTSPKELELIEEDEEDESPEETGRFIRVDKNDKNTIELISPNQSTVMKVRNSKIPIASDHLRF